MALHVEIRGTVMARQYVQKKMSTRAQMLLTGALTITLGFVATIGSPATSKNH